jgi:hypothetical protein
LPNPLAQYFWFYTFAPNQNNKMTSNDFKEEEESLLAQMFDSSVKGFGLFWVLLVLTIIFLVLIGVM